MLQFLAEMGSLSGDRIHPLCRSKKETGPVDSVIVSRIPVRRASAAWRTPSPPFSSAQDALIARALFQHPKGERIARFGWSGDGWAMRGRKVSDGRN